LELMLCVYEDAKALRSMPVKVYGIRKEKRKRFYRYGKKSTLFFLRMIGS
jgi:hypothetical protein